MRLASAVLVPLLACAQGAPPEDSFRSLFDGETLEGWKLIGGRGPGYLVENGLLVCPSDGGGDLYTTSEYANFVLRLEYRMEPGGNSGVAIRAPGHGRASSLGIEIQIIDNDHPRWKGLRPEQLNGSIYDVIPARSGYRSLPGQWNDLEITANGRQISVRLNGVIILDNNLDIIQEHSVLEKHPGLVRSIGYIGLLGHNTRVEFRKIRIRQLPYSAPR